MDSYVSISRAARIVAPISEGMRERRFESGQFHILEMLGNAEISVKAKTAPPPFPFPDRVRGEELSKDWFNSIHNQRHSEDYRALGDWNLLFIEWMRQSLLVCHADIRANLRSPSGEWHAPVEHVDTPGASWSFPETLAWIATRDPLEVSRMRFGSHWEAPIGEEDEQRAYRALVQNDSTRSRMIGWLVLATANRHCNGKCGGTGLIESQERWEICQCVGNAYDELRDFCDGANNPIPEYQPQPTYASFTLTWPDGAHNLRFLRAQIIAKWPATFATSWTVEKMQEWWVQERHTNGKIARTAFMKLPASTGLSGSFEAVWKDAHPEAKRGRPKNSD